NPLCRRKRSGRAASTRVYGLYKPGWCPCPPGASRDATATSHLASLPRRSVRRAVIQRVSFCPMKKRRKKIAVAGAVLLGAAIGLGAFWWNRPRPLRYPGYTLDVTLPTAAAAA